MFDPEAALRDWKTAAQRRLCASELGELEDHLLEEYARLVNAGNNSADAWTAAVATLGDPAEISAEFAKVNRLPVLDRIALTAIITVGFAAIFGSAATIAPHVAVDLLLSLGGMALFIGWLSGLLATVIAAYGTLRSVLASTPNSPVTEAALRLIRRISLIAAMLMVLGFGIFAIRGVIEGGPVGERWWTRVIPQILGSAVTCVCLFAAAVTARKPHLAPRIPLALTAVAGGLILLTWFGPAVFIAHRGHVRFLFLGFGGCTICLLIAALSLRIRDAQAFPADPN
jgi:hypothetical protein